MTSRVKTAIIGAVIALLAFAGVANATAPKPYTIVAWNMTSYVNESTYVWPQTLALYATSDTVDLHVLDNKLDCGHAYQIDAYNTGETTDALIAGGFLTSPNHPQEDLVPGGQSVAYVAIQTPDCVITPPPTPIATVRPPTPTPIASILPPTPKPVASTHPSAPRVTPPSTSTETTVPSANSDAVAILIATIGVLAFAFLFLNITRKKS